MVQIAVVSKNLTFSTLIKDGPGEIKNNMGGQSGANKYESLKDHL